MNYPLSYKLFNRAPIHPVWLCFIFMIILGGGYTLFAAKTGLLTQILDGKVSSISFRATLTAMLLTAYIPMAQFYLIKWSKEHWFKLSEVVNDIPEFDFRLSRFWGVVGLTLQLGLFFGIPWFNGDNVDANFWNPSLIITHTFVIALGWSLYRLFASVIQYANQFSRVAKTMPKIELFNHPLSQVFVQQGVRSALLIVGILSICGNLIIAPGTRLDAAILIGIISGLCAATALINPVIGIHKRIVKEKQAQLSQLQEQILPLSNNLKDDDRHWLKLSTLLALEARIQSVREWPFDASSLSRVAFYITLGLSSWIGAALVEKFLDVFI